MKTNDPVKVKIREDFWREGKFLDRQDNQIKVEIGEPGLIGHEICLKKTGEVKRFDKINQENWPPAELTQFVAEQFEPLTEAIKKAFAELLPNEILEFKEQSILAYHGTVTIDAEIREIQTIGAFIEKPCWVIRVWENIPATRFEPENIEDTEIAECFHYNQVLQPFLNTVFSLKTKDYLNCEGDKTYELDSFF